MDWNLVIYAVVAMGGLGALLGGILAVASVKFHVEVDPRVEKVREVLPGANCGACGIPGCEAAAEAIVEGKIPYDACIAGGNSVSEAVAEVLGIEAGEWAEPLVTVLRCQGGRGKVQLRYQYQGVADCHAAQLVAGGPLACAYGCLGFGDCVEACPFDAMRMAEDGLPQIDLDKCTRCGICINICPRDILAFLPESAEVAVLCVSKDKAKVVREACKIGCIACKACEKVCEPEAITVVDNLAVIDYTKCTSCGKCVEKCPTKCLVWRTKTPECSTGATAVTSEAEAAAVTSSED